MDIDVFTLFPPPRRHMDMDVFTLFLGFLGEPWA
jgi:hypothetical protein